MNVSLNPVPMEENVSMELAIIPVLVPVDTQEWIARKVVSESVGGGGG